MKNPEYTLVIPGRAYSAQASKTSRARYQAEIRRIAAQHISTPLRQDNLYIKVDYFYLPEHKVEGDNLLKPIRDALKGIAYVDDGQITDSRAFEHNRASSVTIEPPIPGNFDDLFLKHEEFVIVTIGVRRMLFMKSNIQMVECGEDSS